MRGEQAKGVSRVHHKCLLVGHLCQVLHRQAILRPVLEYCTVTTIGDKLVWVLSYGLVEVKLGGDALIEKGAASLLAVADKIDVTRMKKPSFMMVLVADGDFAYLRKDGVIVCPIGCLKP